MSDIKYNVIKLHFSSPLHLAKGKEEYGSSGQVLHSDTIKSALLAAALQLYGEEELGLNVNNEVPAFFDAFHISSAFPFRGDEMFFPRPMLRARFRNINMDEQGKMIKKLSWLGKSYFQHLLQGETDLFEKNHFFEDHYFITDDEALLNQKKEHAFLLKSHIQERVKIPHQGEEDENGNKQAPTPFYLDRVHFPEDGGLFFLCKIKNEKFRPVIQSALNLLQDNGIGTDRNVGNGQFSYTWQDEGVSFKQPDKTNRQVNMGLYCPEKQEFTENVIENSYYEIIRRGGYIASAQNPDHSTLRKKFLYMFKEGSVFPYYNAFLKGKIEDIKPDYPGFEHEVWRDGRTIWLPAKTEDQ